MLGFNFVQPADSRAENDAAAELVFARKVQARVDDRIDASYHRELRKSIDPSGLLAVHVAVGRPIVDVAGEVDPESGRVELAVLMDTALTSEHPPPEIVDLQAQRSDRSDSCHNDAAFHGAYTQAMT